MQELQEPVEPVQEPVVLLRAMPGAGLTGGGGACGHAGGISRCSTPRVPRPAASGGADDLAGSGLSYQVPLGSNTRARDLGLRTDSPAGTYP